MLDAFPSAAINLHISYLPWNKGADPNLWSIVEGSPKGVSIHYIDQGVDTGDIIVQEKIEFDYEQETLASSYVKLHEAIFALFKRHWSEIKSGSCPRKAQVGDGSLHKVKDRQSISACMTDGWHTQLSDIVKFQLEE